MSVYVCVCVVCVCVYIYIYIYIYMYIHCTEELLKALSTRAHRKARYVCVCVCVHIHTLHTYIHRYMHTQGVHTSECGEFLSCLQAHSRNMYIHTYIHIYTHTGSLHLRMWRISSGLRAHSSNIYIHIYIHREFTPQNVANFFWFAGTLKQPVPTEVFEALCKRILEDIEQ
jgi:hypothetical protein